MNINIIEICFAAAVAYGLYRLWKHLSKKADILPEIPLKKVRPIKKKTNKKANS